jgi:hypothetical protein
MPRLFGRDIAGEIARKLGKHLLPATLIKVYPGVREPGNPAGGTQPTTEQFPCRGFVADMKERFVDEDQVKRGDQIVMLLGATIDRGKTEPAAGDIVLIEGRRRPLVKLLERDPAAATYSFAVRGP